MVLSGENIRSGQWKSQKRSTSRDCSDQRPPSTRPVKAPPPYLKMPFHFLLLQSPFLYSTSSPFPSPFNRPSSEDETFPPADGGLMISTLLRKKRPLLETSSHLQTTPTTLHFVSFLLAW